LSRRTTAAHDLWWTGWNEAMVVVAEERGFRTPTRAHFDEDSHAGGALFVGDPEQVAARILALHDALGHMRHFLQMDIGRLPQRDFLSSIELLGTAVKPLIDRELGPEPADLRGAIRR
jgi:alkanesulfonate monooxygenase SsuD/methylene tetrahydromethanopterin reductase-like flavin-dependent oxidoreductase (luciferase family)